MQAQHKIKKVAIYSRKSRPDETNDVLKRQLDVLIEMCIKNMWEYEVFQEIGSSQDINIELNKMLEKVQSFYFDAVVTTEQSRLGRNDLVIAQVKQILANYGVILITPTQILDLSTQEGSLYSDMQTVVDKQEYLNTKKRLIRGKRQSAKDGNWVGATPPVGYKYDNKTKKLVPNEYAPVIQEIFRLYLSGKTSTDIARLFEIQGFLTPLGSNWSSARISAVLSNPVYKGTIVYGKTKVSKIEKKPSGTPKQLKTDLNEQIIVENAHEAIISPEDWERAKNIREGRLTKPPSARIGKVAFTGLIKCSLCGSTHSFQRRKGKELRITSCQTRIYQEDGSYTVCKNKGVRLDLFEKLFFANFKKYTNKLEQHLEKIKSGIIHDQSFTTEDEKKTLLDSIKKIDVSIKRVQKGFIAEIYTEAEAQKEIKQLKFQKEQIVQQLKRLNSISQDEQIDMLQTSINKLKKILDGTTDLEIKEINELLAAHIDFIEYKRVGDHKSEIKMKIHYKR